MEGYLHEIVLLEGEVQTEGSLAGEISAADSIFGEISIGSGGSYPTYQGEYIVDPDFNGKTLDTDGKVMASDVVVEPIRVSVTANPAGGNTVYIGGN